MDSQDIGYLKAKVEDLESDLGKVQEKIEALQKWSYRSMGTAAAGIFFMQLLIAYLKYGGKL